MHKSYMFEKVGDFNLGYYSQAGDPTSIRSSYDITSINLRGRLSHKEQFIYRRTVDTV